MSSTAPLSMKPARVTKPIRNADVPIDASPAWSPVWGSSLAGLRAVTDSTGTVEAVRTRVAGHARRDG